MVTIGVFEREQQALEAVRLLRAAGAHKDELRVLVDNEENAPLLRAAGETPLEGVAGVREALERQERDEGSGMAVAGEGAVPLAGAAGLTASSGGASVSAGFGGPAFVLTGFGMDGVDNGRVLRAMGIPDGAVGECRQALGEGRIVVLAGREPAEQTRRLMEEAGALRVIL